MFIFPLELAQTENFMELYPFSYSVFIRAASILFSLDIIIQLNTGINHKGIILIKRNDIAKRYVRTKFIIDALSILVLFASKIL